MKLLFLLPGIRKELSVAVPAGYGNENGKLRKQAMQEESRKELVSGHIARIPCAGDALAAATKLHV